MVELSNLTQLTKEQAILYCHQTTAQPSLLMIFIVFVISFLVFGLLFVKKDRGRLFTILTCTFITAGIFLLILYFLPITTQNIISWLRNLFS